MIDEKEVKAFWQDIVYKDGKLDDEAVMKELADYYHAIQEVPKVYEAITRGRMSKLMYYAKDVIAEYEDDLNENYVHKDDIRGLL